VADFEYPDRVIIGTESEESRKILAEIYRPFMRKRERLIFMSRPSAELTKVFANSMLAMRISAMNSVTELAEKFGADLAEIRKGVGSDPRIGFDFLFPGGATFGGSCFPKDVRALVAIMEENKVDAGIFREILKINYKQRQRFIFKIFSYFNNSFRRKKFAIWGLSFKPGTDDVREAASLDVVHAILGEMGKVAVFDSHAMENFRRQIGEKSGRIVYQNDQYEALRGADALIILTDAMEFRSLNITKIKDLMKKPVIFDGKNLHDPLEMAEQGIEYYCMGRPHYSPVK
jgi:UDPglucose 6-dehydrogenase